MKMNPIEKYKRNKKYKRIRETDDFKQKLNEAVNVCYLFQDLCNTNNGFYLFTWWTDFAFKRANDGNCKILENQRKNTNYIWCHISLGCFPTYFYEKFKNYSETQEKDIRVFLENLFQKPFNEISAYFKNFDFVDSFYFDKETDFWCTRRTFRLPEGMKGEGDAQFFIDEIKKALSLNANTID